MVSGAAHKPSGILLHSYFVKPAVNAVISLCGSNNSIWWKAFSMSSVVKYLHFEKLSTSSSILGIGKSLSSVCSLILTKFFTNPWSVYPPTASFFLTMEAGMLYGDIDFRMIPWLSIILASAITSLFIVSDSLNCLVCSIGVFGFKWIFFQFFQFSNF